MAYSSVSGRPAHSRRVRPAADRGSAHSWTAGRMVGQVVLVIAALGIAIPTLWVFVASFKDKSEFYGSPWTWPKGLHWQNYADAFVDAKLGQYFGTSVLVTVMSMAMVLVIALPCSYVLARFDFPGKKILKLAVQAGLFINVNYIVVPIFLMLVDADKLLYNIMPNGFFVNNVFILALVYASTSLPFTIFLLQDFFASIPKDYEEAAMIDGASQTRIMTRIFFPMAMPAISMSMLFNFLTYWNDYIISMTLMTGNNRTVQVGLLNLMQTQKAATNYGRRYAGMVIVMVPVLIFYAVVQKKLLETSTMGGIK